MKTKNLIKAAASSILMSLFMSSAATAGTIQNTAHDFSTSSWSGGEICVVCHTPHNGDTTEDAPLWNHAVTAETFTMYTGTGSTLDATMDNQPTGTSKLCLSCHDGATALDSFGGNVGGTVMNGPAAIGSTGTGSLTNDHPISITYDTALSGVDPGLHDPSVTNVTIGAGGDKARTGTVASLMLSGGKVQCTSCHDVHNGSVGPGTNFAPFLKVSKAGSAICLTCHNK
ncbi:MAG: cytochrome c3 family protein [Gammaproteobacteria bacterium]|nr:cytochrome c3 family protein [Gammaproteobacteria bacterium]